MNRHLFRAIRLRNNLPLTQLAKRLHLTLEQITAIEKGTKQISEPIKIYMKGLAE